jgi:ABC-type antimicrobial peptide transport system permease subunit
MPASNIKSRSHPSRKAISSEKCGRGVNGGMTLGERKLVEFVGIAKTTRYFNILEPPMDFVYLPFSQNQQSELARVVESKSPDATVLAPVLRRVIQEIDRNIPVFDVRSMKDIYNNRVVKGPNLIAEMIGWMGIMGLVLAVIGLYGLAAYSVSCRTREIGIRMAIGADRTSVMKMVLKQGLMLGVTGVAVGLVIGIFACRAITSGRVLNFGHISVLHFAAVSLLLILTTTAATYIPARRASRIDPIRALREE